MEPKNNDFLKALDGKEFLAAQNLTSIDSEARTVDVVFYSGVDIARRDWWTGKDYILRFDPDGADLSLLNNGAPVLDNHRSFDGSASQKGRVERAWSEGKTKKATLRFSKRPTVAEIWQDIEDKIISKFSMGVEILKLIKEEEKGVEIRLAKKWRPFELSIAPIPADFNTTTLGAEPDPAGAEKMGVSPGGKVTMEKENETTANEPVQAAAVQPAPVNTEALKEAGRLEELARVDSIRKLGKKHKLEILADEHIAKRTTLEKFREVVLEALAAESETEKINPDHPILIKDEGDKRREEMMIALDAKFQNKTPDQDNGNEFLGLGLFRIAEESVRRQYGLRRIPRQEEVIKLAMQNTSDFGNVLENSARKQLLAQYALAPTTYRAWTKRSTTPDFKTMSRSRLSEAPGFLVVPEGAGITIATMSDSKEQYALVTYGRGVSFTRQMLINDDLGAFNDLIGAFGMQAARKENAVVYAILNANAAMADTVALFHATHANLGSGAIANTALDAMYSAMAKQTGLDGVSVLNLQARFLIVPKAKEATARNAMIAIGPNVKASDQNWFAGRFEVIADAELDGTSTVVWYAAADPNVAPGIEFAHLEGAEGPQFIRKENESGILGIQFYAFTDFAAKAVDWRPLYKSTGV